MHHTDLFAFDEGVGRVLDDLVAGFEAGGDVIPIAFAIAQRHALPPKAAVGLRDIIVVDTPDALLVCSAERSQDVRRIAEEVAGLSLARAASDEEKP